MHEFLEHTGDIKVRVKSCCFKEALKELLNVMFDIVKAKGDGEAYLVIKSSGETKEDIVVNLLNDVLSEIEIKRLIPVSVEDIKVMNEKVSVKIKCKKGNPNTMIKAVTYHQLKVNDGEIEVVFDI